MMITKGRKTLSYPSDTADAEVEAFADVKRKQFTWVRVSDSYPVVCPGQGAFLVVTVTWGILE